MRHSNFTRHFFRMANGSFCFLVAFFRSLQSKWLSRWFAYSRHLTTTTRVLYFFQGVPEVKPLLHWPPVTFISTSLRNCKKEGSLSTICSGSQSFPSASARSHSSQWRCMSVYAGKESKNKLIKLGLACSHEDTLVLIPVHEKMEFFQKK